MRFYSSLFLGERPLLLTAYVLLLQALVYTDGVLVSGSLEALVLHMVPTADYYPDRAFLFAFLLSSRLFIRPHELLGEVCALAEAQQRLAEMQGMPKVNPTAFSHSLVVCYTQEAL